MPPIYPISFIHVSIFHLTHSLYIQINTVFLVLALVNFCKSLKERTTRQKKRGMTKHADLAA